MEQIKKLYSEGNEEIYNILNTMSDEAIRSVEEDLTKEDWPNNYELINFLENYIEVKNSL